MVEILNTLILGLFTLGLIACVFAIARRFIDYRREGIKPPLLAYRDLGLLVGLSLPFLLIFVFRALGWTHIVVGTPTWTLATGIPPILGVAQFVWFEYFIIERRDSRAYTTYLQAHDAEKLRLLKEELVRLEGNLKDGSSEEQKVDRRKE